MKLSRWRNAVCLFLLLSTGQVLAMACEAGEWSALGQRERDLRIASHLSQTGTCVESEHIRLCAASDEISAAELGAFLDLADDGAKRIREYLGRYVELPGEDSRRVEIYIANCVGIPHTTGLDEPWVFIPPRAVLRRMAPYLHELVHVMAQWSWRKSEWLAEGFASHVASRVSQGHAGYDRSFILPDGLSRLAELYHSPIGQELIPLIGLPGRARSYSNEHSAIASKLTQRRREYAPAYYAMSWSFVEFLLVRIDLPGLHAVAISDRPSETLLGLTGKSMEEHIAEWQSSLVNDPVDHQAMTHMP